METVMRTYRNGQRFIPVCRSGAGFRFMGPAGSIDTGPGARVPVRTEILFGFSGGVVQKKVFEILLPYRRYIPISPALSADENISRAIQVMLEHDVRYMTVVRKNRPIGMVRLEDALFALGLQPGDRKD